MAVVAAAHEFAPCAGADAGLSSADTARFHDLYRNHFDFVFRNLGRLGVPPASVDDALQDVFIVALRRIADYQDGTHPKAWLFAIAQRVASDHRRTHRRKGHGEPLPDDGGLPSARPGPFDQLAQSEDVQYVYRCLDDLDDAKRNVFIMSELEELTAPQIARELGLSVNTVYTRLRAARARFAEVARRLRSGDRSP